MPNPVVLLFMEEGYLKGETCNRNGCQGVIAEHDSESSCSCHINPPCYHCTTSREYCPECDWDGEEEQSEVNSIDLTNSYKGFGSKKMHDDYHEQLAKQEAEDKIFYSMFNGNVDPDKLRVRYQLHTHFSMIKIGVFPKGSETRQSLTEKIKGTFGGRFEMFTDHSFKYIAYTD